MNAKKIANIIIEAFESGNKCLVCGNGGSATMADHFAGELICRFEKERRPLPAISLTSNTAILTAQANDYNFESIFGRQILALGQHNDILVVFSTSGKSKNCLYAIEIAIAQGMKVIDFPRKGKNTAEIQEYQLKLMHDVVREVERTMFPI